MNMTKTRRFQVVLWGFVLLAAAAVSPSSARGDEPPACLKCNVTERGIPFLSKIPYVSRLFKKTAAAEELERIGVDFDIDVCQDCPGVCQPSARPRLIVFRHTAHGEIAAECCENEPCCGKDCEEASACCRASCETAKSGLSWERVVELTAKNAALEAMLEAQDSFQEEKSDLVETLTEALVEKARLEAKVESQAQHIELTKEMLTLVSENARLKAQVEMAEVKVALVHELAKLALENEQLKLALQTRHNRGQLADEGQILPPASEAKSSRAAPARKASYHDADPQPRRPAALEQ